MKSFDFSNDGSLNNVPNKSHVAQPPDRHDALSTTAAVLASFYLRFESDLPTDRLTSKHILNQS
jgi:hypothetical protein